MLNRRAAVSLLFAPLVLIATELAHMAAYRLAYPDGGFRRSVLEETGHGYLRHWPAGLAALLGAVVVALVLRSAQARRGASGRIDVRATWFVLLPPLLFALQEHLERLAATGGFQWTTALAPSFVVGLVLQVPFGFAAYLLARFALRAAERLGRALAPARVACRCPRVVRKLVSRTAQIRPSRFVQLQGSRAPPSAAF
jgi:hypothetical protein